MMFATHMLAVVQEFVTRDPETGARVTITATTPVISFAQMGFMRWPMTFCAAMVAVLAARAAWQIGRGGAERAAAARSAIDGSIFWGAYALTLGVLGTVIGLTLAAHAIETIGRAETPLVWGGVKVALSTTVYGFFIFLVAALLWLGLKQWHRAVVFSRA